MPFVMHARVHAHTTSSKVSTIPPAANGTSVNESLLSTKPTKTPKSSTVKRAEAESSGAELCNHMAIAVTSRSSSTPTCHPPSSPAESESCSTRYLYFYKILKN